MQIGATKKKLLHIVVKDNKTSMALLDNGVFNRPVNIIPNEEIVVKRKHSSNLKNHIVSIAGKYNGFACLATDLVQYNSSLTPTIDFLFGGFAITSSL